MKIQEYIKEQSKFTSKRTIIITILFSLFSALSTYLLFDSMEGFKTEVKESKMAVKGMQEQVNFIEYRYKAQVSYWKRKNNHLMKQIENTESALNQSKKNINSLQGRIQRLITDGKVLKDTIEIITNCDSLKEQVTQFISETETRDSLCDSEIVDLKTVIQNKDSALAISEKSLVLIKQAADSSLMAQRALADKLQLADKKRKRENIKSKILSAAVFILSGVTATLLLQK